MSSLSYLKELESESIYILREVASSFKNQALLYSIGKDSSVLLHLAFKAFYPDKIPFTLLHIDTGFKFKEMYDFREKVAKKYKVNLEVFRNEEAIKISMNPFKYGRDKCCNELKTNALLKAIKFYNFDSAIAGARRDEEKSRSKERFFSIRDKEGKWDPLNQRPELWGNLNSLISDQEHIRVFPLSNWTEIDIWKYIELEDIEVVSLYFAKERKVIKEDDFYIPYENNLLEDNDRVETKLCRFRSLGCTHCTGVIPSKAKDIIQIQDELVNIKTSERASRLIDYTLSSSMEKKKKDGYF